MAMSFYRSLNIFSSADQTARPQVLDRDSNPDYYDIIKIFEVCTGVGVLINTSFNFRGESTILIPEQAISIMDRSPLNALGMNDITLLRSTD